MKKLIIILLALALAAALFLTRPTKADFERYVREEVKVVEGKPTGGPTIGDVIRDKVRTVVAEQANKSAADVYLEGCTYENYGLWTNVKRDGKTVYTGAVGHWFERGSGA